MDRSHIVLANEIALLSEKLGVDVVEVITAANTLPKGQHNVNILYPGAGVGGSCLLKDPWFVANLGDEHGLDLQTPRTSRRVNQQMPGHMLELVERSLGDVAASKIAVLGYAFKTGTDDTRNTSATEIITGLLESGADIRVSDPFVSAETIESEVGLTPSRLPEALNDVDAVLIVTGHKQYRSLSAETLEEYIDPLKQLSSMANSYSIQRCSPKQQYSMSVSDEVLEMSDRVPVTGAAGFVGRHLIDYLVTERDDKIVATDIVETPPERYSEHVGERVLYRTGDLTDGPFLDELLKMEFDHIYYLAAVVGVNEYVKNALHITAVNIIATHNILQRIKDTDVRFVFPSTSEVYGKNPNVPWHEDQNRVTGPPTVDRWSYSTGK